MKNSIQNSIGLLARVLSPAKAQLLFAAALALPLAMGVMADDKGSSGGDDPGSGDFGMSDPTVGTLPLMGAGGSEFDQTITLRGEIETLRQIIHDASGDGFIEVIDLGDGNAWVRFYGDVSIELSRERLGEVQIGLFGGFEGNGMQYVVGNGDGFADPLSLESGYEVPLDLGRAADVGLLDEPLYLYAIHQVGRRTVTGFELANGGASVVIYQDV